MKIYHYEFFHHCSDKFPEHEVEDAIVKKDFIKFCNLMIEWNSKYRDEDYNWIEFLPSTIFLTDDNNTELIPVTYENFLKINSYDCECG